VPYWVLTLVDMVRELGRARRMAEVDVRSSSGRRETLADAACDARAATVRQT
jgi:hypothetical protein